ncbi:hypothetical protein [Bradyrhizobium sp. th.b2]|uniref:hypothetical protein n=1 Tax=Bradyrhizobium sp. th-b2 TaxID=172088 RepID=UPI0012EB80C5|nr:hypothetical protein [Bradyrhizobium sp. th.b2]
MKFTLTYEGSLPPSANARKNGEKWKIRKAFDPQIRDLWASHPALQEIERNGRYFPKHGGAVNLQPHHQHPGPVEAPWVPKHPRVSHGTLDLCEPIERHGAWFRPLVRESFALHCGLKIVFLRKESPGKVYQGGDIDGRIKTLVDALTMPQHKEQILEPNAQRDPIYCLLQDDSMVSGLAVESERLLGAQDHPADYVRLTIEVDVRVRQAMIYNQSFLG